MVDENRVLFCNIGWMSRYEGLEGKPDRIVGGGSFVVENKKGNESCNFVKCSDGFVYGHVETWKGDDENGIDRKSNIDELGASPGDSHIDGITVIWTATDPSLHGRRVVGWYLNARVFRERQQFDRAPSHQHKLDGNGTYHIRAKTKDATIVPLESRKARLKSGKGWMGHAQWWFPHLHIKNSPEIKSFVRRVSAMIGGEAKGSLDETKSKPRRT